MAQKTSILTVRLSARDARRIGIVQKLGDVDKATLLREFIEDGLRKRVLNMYMEEKVTAQMAAEILEIPLREFLGLLEKNGIEVNWAGDTIRDYMKKHYGG